MLALGQAECQHRRRRRGIGGRWRGVGEGGRIAGWTRRRCGCLDVTGVERDPARPEMARASLAALRLQGTVLDGDATARRVVDAAGIAHALVPDGVEAEGVSDGGDLVAACL